MQLTAYRVVSLLLVHRDLGKPGPSGQQLRLGSATKFVLSEHLAFLLSAPINVVLKHTHAEGVSHICKMIFFTINETNLKYVDTRPHTIVILFHHQVLGCILVLLSSPMQTTIRRSSPEGRTDSMRLSFESDQQILSPFVKSTDRPVGQPRPSPTRTFLS